MIGAPTIDPREGDRRRKALQSALQRSVQQRSGMSRFSRSGLGRGSVAGFGRRPVSTGGRPSGILSFLSNKGPQGFSQGLASYLGRSGGLGQLVKSTQLPSAPLPSASAPTPAPGYPGGGGLGGTPTNPGALDEPGAPPPDPNDVDPGFHIQDTTPLDGLIPLGGGLFLDPSTGMLTTGPGGISIYPDNPAPSGTGLQE